MSEGAAKVWRQYVPEIMAYRPITRLDVAPLMTFCTLTCQLEDSQAGGTVPAKLLQRWTQFALHFGIIGGRPIPIRRPLGAALHRAPGTEKRTTSRQQQTTDPAIAAEVLRIRDRLNALPGAIQRGKLPEKPT